MATIEITTWSNIGRTYLDTETGVETVVPYETVAVSYPTPTPVPRLDTLYGYGTISPDVSELHKRLVEDCGLTPLTWWQKLVIFLKENF